MASVDISDRSAGRGVSGAVQEGVSTPGDSVELRGATQRLANVERLRLIAMLEIVAFHVSERRLPIIAGLGLPTFLLLNNAFNGTLSERMGTRAFMRLKVSRLLVPWLVWSLIYGAVLVLEKLRHDESIGAALSVWMIVGGTYEHLWFVPFALFGGVLVAWLQATTRHLPHRGVTLGALVAGSAVVSVVALLLRRGGVDWPALQWLFALPSTVLGFAMGRAVLSSDRKQLVQVAASASSIAVVCFALSIAWAVPEVLMRYSTSLAIVSLAFVWPGHGDRLSQRLTPLLFGIYLSHPLIARVYRGLHGPELPLALFATLVFASAAILVVGLRRTPLRILV